MTEATAFNLQLEIDALPWIGVDDPNGTGIIEIHREVNSALLYGRTDDKELYVCVKLCNESSTWITLQNYMKRTYSGILGQLHDIAVQITYPMPEGNQTLH